MTRGGEAAAAERGWLNGERPWRIRFSILVRTFLREAFHRFSKGLLFPGRVAPATTARLNRAFRIIARVTRVGDRRATFCTTRVGVRLVVGNVSRGGLFVVTLPVVRKRALDAGDILRYSAADGRADLWTETLTDEFPASMFRARSAALTAPPRAPSGEGEGSFGDEGEYLCRRTVFLGLLTERERDGDRRAFAMYGIASSASIDGRPRVSVRFMRRQFLTWFVSRFLYGAGKASSKKALVLGIPVQDLRW